MRPAWVLGLGLLSIVLPLFAPFVWFYGARVTDSYVVAGLDPPVTAVFGRRVAAALCEAADPSKLAASSRFG